MKKLLIGAGLVILMSVPALACECEPVYGLTHGMQNRISDAANMSRQPTVKKDLDKEKKDTVAARSDQAVAPQAAAPQGEKR